MEHHFGGPSYTIGIEEELMIVAGESYSLVTAIESFLEEAPEGQIKPELMESVLEISTDAVGTVGEADDQLRALRAQVTRRAATRGLRVGSAGTHSFALWEDQRIVARPALSRPDLGVAVRGPPGADVRSEPRPARADGRNRVGHERRLTIRSDPAGAGPSSSGSRHV